MNDQNQSKPKQKPEETPKTVLGGTSAAKSSSGWKNLFAKRWVSPAIFMAAAAIIVTLMWIYQGADQSKSTTGKVDPTEVSQGETTAPEGKGDETPEVVLGDELMQWPIANKAVLKEEISFYDEKSSDAEREAALVQVGDTFSPHMGIDFVDPSGKTFDVLAALSGKVTYVKTEPTNGNVIEITHEGGLVTVYQSVTDIQVAEGDDVTQGTVIAKAGRNDLERDLGIHLHYETRNNGKPINPSSLITE
ncbi:M23 family metallopeptidase [Paenibacillus sp. PL91]|uniref:M23 family metallopeptidase n=1 Tax=Paenibacillus sp. PL91 TaxID=2729538 RepID=UPI00145E1D1F|nr:M23 family metallopeptidase [Paenibacillus sp. PL91]MBC9201872.1 M23 family metallopeptidase [Paenibacillus sp. PL91]